MFRVGPEENVIGFEITMDDVAQPHMSIAFDDLSEDIEGLVLCETVGMPFYVVG
jgi:hypothetical protein